MKLNGQFKQDLLLTRLKKLEAPILASPNYSEPFNIFSFASETTLVVVILQNNK